MVLSESDPNGEVTVLLENNVGLSKGDLIGEVTLLVR